MRRAPHTIMALRFFARSRAGRRAFSNLEMITAIAIGMIIAIIGFTSLTTFQKELPVKSVTKRFSHALSTARSYAIGRNTYFQVSLDLDHSNWWIDEITDPNPPPGTPAPIIPPKPKIVHPEKMDHRVRVQGVFNPLSPVPVTTGIERFIFGPDGSADRDIRVVFYQLSLDPADVGNVFTVRLYAPTGINQVFRHAKP